MKLLSLVLGLLLLAATGVLAQTTNEIEGQKLVQDILLGTPTENVQQTGTLRIKDSKGTTNIPVSFGTEIVPGYWIVGYDANPTNNNGKVIRLVLRHRNGQPDVEYLFCEDQPRKEGLEAFKTLDKTQIWTPFANSDFWIADLGLEFFHWPQQKVLKHESRRTRDCTVLESTNTSPTLGSYSRVVSWIDNESHGIVHADAYDANNKLLKEFDPKSFKKVNGQWELQDMEIRNVQTHSVTRIRFDLSGKS